MERTDLKHVYSKAIKEKFAIGAFNFVNMESLKAIVESANDSSSPVIVAVSESAIEYMGMEYVINLVSASKKNSHVPIVLHLDHGSSFEVCKKCIDAGFDSVMIDASGLPFEENVKLTKSVVLYAKKFNVCVEGELGRLAGIEDKVNVSESNSFYTDPLEAKKFVLETGVDSLAVAIGTSHGAFKFSHEPRLAFDVLEKIENLLPNFPLVLHGSSSIDSFDVEMLNKFGGQMEGAKGVPYEILEKASRFHNICKINVDSDLRIAYTASIRKFLFENPKVFDVRKIFKPAKEQMKIRIKEKIKCFGSLNRG